MAFHVSKEMPSLQHVFMFVPKSKTKVRDVVLAGGEAKST